MTSQELSITFMSGSQDGHTLNFRQPNPGDELVLHIGRREGCDVCIRDDNQVSRLHAKLFCVSQPVTASESVEEPVVLAFWLEDMGSRNGTYVERERDSIRGRVSLQPGRLFRIGRTWLRLDVPLSI
ncbi:MAG: FHA domain-containing protein [Chloroflexi bacterium]|nr:FHA domain-containing protein [Chloroflexota bacterium]